VIEENTETAQAIAGIAKSASSTAGSIYQGVELGNRASDVLAQSRDEALATIQEGQARSQLLRQRGNASLDDISFVQALADSHQRTLFQEERRSIGKIQAEAAGSGVVSTTGSPLLAQLDATIESGRQMAGQQLVADVQKRRLRFEAEQDLERAGDILDQTRAEAQAQLNQRAAQADNIRQRQLQTILGGINTATNPRLVSVARDLFKSKSPSAQADETDT